MKIIAFSDTHGMHDYITLDYSDVLIFAGDTHCTTELQLARFLEWFSEQPSEYKIFVPGNHEIYCEQYPEETQQLMADHDIIYLNGEGFMLEEKWFWGSPVTPKFYDWAFMPSEQIRAKHWKSIPESLDVLITHGPAFGILDNTKMTKVPVGCPHLLKIIQERKPKHHVFGHIHSAAGETIIGDTHFHNVSIVTDEYKLNNLEIQEFEI